MLSDEVIEKVIERLVRRIENGNTYVLKRLGENIKKIGSLTPYKAQELVQILKYGGDYDKIVKELAKITELNIRDIQKIFEEVAKNDYNFAKQFYDYRGLKFIPYEQNIELKNQVNAITRITAQEYYNLTRTSMVCVGMLDDKGTVTLKTLQQAYYDLLDEAVLNITQGKETFQEAMYRQIKAIGSGGLKVIYPTTYVDKKGIVKNRTMRLDTAVRMQLKDAIRTLHNETQEIYGREFNADGVEVSHHSNPAKDHEDTVDGKQFAKIDVIKEQIANGTQKEIKLEDIQGERVKIKGKWYKDFNYVNNNLDRPVSTLNCYHYTFAIILGISKPSYTQEELNKDKEKNHNGFEYNGKHYSLYEGEQLLRSIELEIRKAKDEQIMGKEAGIIESVDKAQQKITALTKKYKEVLKASKLPSKLDRARVSQYRRISIEKLKQS